MRRVLLVDDSALIRNAMQAALEPFGLELEHAENGELALALACSSSWDLIFLDVVMPVMDGPTALRALRARGVTTPVVLATSVSTAAVVASAVKLGGVQYVVKPFTAAQIRSIAAHQLALDPGVLERPPRVLVQHGAQDIPERLRRGLPRHVVLETTSSLSESLELVEQREFALVILESRELGAELVSVANVLRRSLPAAGIFALRPDARPSSAWCPDEGLDGWLPLALDPALVRGFLYATFLRQITALDGTLATAARFHGAADGADAFATAVARQLVSRARGLDVTADLRVDVTRVAEDPDLVATVVDAADRALREAGATPTFVLPSAVHTAVAQRLPRIATR